MGLLNQDRAVTTVPPPVTSPPPPSGRPSNALTQRHTSLNFKLTTSLLRERRWMQGTIYIYTTGSCSVPRLRYRLCLQGGDRARD